MSGGENLKDYIIEVEGLDYTYADGTYALRDLSLKIRRGSKTAIIGSNGAGKTTLFLSLNGVYKPHKGKIKFSGKELKYTKKEITRLREELGIVFQDSNTQLFSASVYQDVSFGPINLGLDKEKVKALVEDTLAQVSLLDIKSKPTHFLSGGQKKRVALAGVLAMNPQVIFLDEPTAFIDPKTSRELMSFFDRLHKEGKTLVLSTHDLDLVYEWAEYIFVMKEGKILAEGTPQEIFSKDELLEQADLEKPWIVEAYQVLIEKNHDHFNGKMPKNKEEFFSLLKTK